MKRNSFYVLLASFLAIFIQSCASTPRSPATENYRVDTLGKGLWRIQSITGEAYETSSMYLIEGSREALMIDAGSGKDGLREIVQQLIGDKPFKLALTHGHVDHSGGISYFPEAYIHPSDANIARGIPIDTDIICRRESINDGDVFDLGDKRIEVIGVPGHSSGSVAFLNRAERYMMTGDTISPFVLAHVSWQPLSVFLDSVRKLEILKSAIDTIYVGHHEQEIRGSKMTAKSITDMRILAEKVLEGTMRTSAYYSQRIPNGRAASYGSVRLVFDPTRLR